MIKTRLPLKNHFHKLIWILTFAFNSTGCTSNKPESIAVKEEWSSNQCYDIEPGISIISYDELEEIKNRNVLRPLNNTQPETVDDNFTLVKISMGKKTTAGYSIGLESKTAEIQSENLILKVTKQTPQPGSVSASVMTSPCVVVSIPKNQETIKSISAGDWQISTL